MVYRICVELVEAVGASEAEIEDANADASEGEIEDTNADAIFERADIVDELLDLADNNDATSDLNTAAEAVRSILKDSNRYFAV